MRVDEHCVVGLPAVVLQLVAASPNLSMSYVPSRTLPLALRIMHCPRGSGRPGYQNHIIIIVILFVIIIIVIVIINHVPDGS